MRHDVLNLRRMLRRGSHEHRTVLAAFRPGGVGFQIEMFLTAQLEFTGEFQGRVFQFLRHVAAPDEIGFVMKTFFTDGL